MKNRVLNRKIWVSGVPHKVGTGWLAPQPDLRDYTPASRQVTAFNRKLKLPSRQQVRIRHPAETKSRLRSESGTAAYKSKIDLREWCSPIENQLELGSCTAHAAAGIVEYFEKRAFGKHIDASRLFLYKTTRNLMQVSGDTGAWLRETMGALVLCGVPDEKYWPYKVKDFDNEPSGFVYALAENYSAVKYFCHDPQGSDIQATEVLASVKSYLSAGIPAMFGLWGFQSFEDTDVPGDIPYPCKGESTQWGHAVMALGYDDDRRISNLKCGTETKGAIMIRNSWGKTWGDNGYGWLPYDYVLNGLALDFWSILDMRWIDTGNFGL